MYCVKILYPNKPGSSFNLKHLLEVHIPLGLGLLRKHCDVTPDRCEIDVNPYGLAPDAQVPYHALCSVYFGKNTDADAFQKLFAIEEAAREVKADWPNYTDADPQIMISEVIELDSASFARVA